LVDKKIKIKNNLCHNIIILDLLISSLRTYTRCTVSFSRFNLFNLIQNINLSHLKTPLQPRTIFYHMSLSFSFKIFITTSLFAIIKVVNDIDICMWNAFHGSF
jgi:hypothetical protein